MPSLLAANGTAVVRADTAFNLKTHGGANALKSFYRGSAMSDMLQKYIFKMYQSRRF